MTKAKGFTGKPQKDGKGVERFGEHWGISREQCQQLLLELRMDPHWDPRTDMYTFVNEYVKPRTKGRGMGLALWMNRDAPLEVNQMVSHCWAENVEEFLAQVIQSSSPGDVLFICAFSIYQCEDGAGPSISEQIGTVPAETPFGRVLSHVLDFDKLRGPLARHYDTLQWLPSALLTFSFVCSFLYPAFYSRLPKWDGRCYGLLLSINGTNYNGHSAGDQVDYAGKLGYYLDGDGVAGGGSPSSTCVFRPVAGWVCSEYVAETCAAYAWPVQGVGMALFLASIVAKVLQLIAPNVGGMIVVPTRAVDMYTRLWCVYEIFFAAVRVGIRVDIARTLITCGACSSEHATCSNQADQRRIRAEVEDSGGFTRIDTAVRKERVKIRQKISWAFFRAFVLGAVGTGSAMMLLAIEAGFAIGLCSAYGAVCSVGAVLVLKLLIPKQGALTKRQALLAGYILPLTIFIVVLLVTVVRWGWWGPVCGITHYPEKDAVNCESGFFGFLLGIQLFTAFQFLGMTFIMLPVFHLPQWARHSTLCLSLVSGSCAVLGCTVIVVRYSGGRGAQLAYLLPLYDASVAGAGVFAMTSFFSLYVPVMLVAFNVHIQSKAERTDKGEAEDRRMVKPKLGERLVYLWHCRLYPWIPLPAKPSQIDWRDVPEELAARGLDCLAWQEWIGRLEAVKVASWRSPRMWLWTGFMAASTVFFIIATPLVALWPHLLRECIPYFNLSPFQKGLRKWMDEFNEVLTPLGMLVKAQTFKHGTCEVSYLSFAVTQEESFILQDEPIITPGESMCIQGGGITCRDSGRLPCDWGRVI